MLKRMSFTEKINEESGAQQDSVENWGKKEIAYLVRKQKFGHYRCIYFSSTSGEVNGRLRDYLRIADTVIKFQIHKLSSKVRKFKGNPQRPSRDEAGAANA
jgi:ribosomal protein S6